MTEQRICEKYITRIAEEAHGEQLQELTLIFDNPSGFSNQKRATCLGIAGNFDWKQIVPHKQ